MGRVRLPLRTQSCNVWIDWGQPQSQVRLSIDPACVFCFMMAGEEKPFTHGYVVAKERRKHTAQGIRSSAVSKSPSTTTFWKQTSMFCGFTTLLNSPAHQEWSPEAFQRFSCWTGFSCSCSFRPSLRNICGTKRDEVCNDVVPDYWIVDLNTKNMLLPICDS